MLVPREGGTVDSVTQKITKGNMFTHHQKSVVVDTADPRYYSFCLSAVRLNISCGTIYSFWIYLSELLERGKMPNKKNMINNWS